MADGISNQFHIKSIKLQDLTILHRQWIVNNEFDKQPVKLRIEPLMSVKPYNDPGNVNLTDFSEAG